MYAASSTSSTVSSESSTTTSEQRVVIRHRDSVDRHGVATAQRATNAVTSSQRQHSKKSTRGLTTPSQQQKNCQNPTTLQSLVKTKCWGIAPLWKFVSYEVETQPDQVRVNIVFFKALSSKAIFFRGEKYK